MHFRRVVFPDPLGPIITKNSPTFTLKERPSTADCPASYLFDSSCTSSAESPGSLLNIDPKRRRDLRRVYLP